MKNIVIFIDWYLPGYKAGGPIFSVANLVNVLKEKANLTIVTSDRDFRDKKPYNDIETDEIISKEGVDLIYLSPGIKRIKRIKVILRKRFDIVYLNSIFSFNYTLIPIYFGKRSKKIEKIILAPRGMLGEGAMNIKKIKKRLFILLTKIIGFFDNIVWHASTQLEKEEIKNVYGNKAHVEIAKDISSFNFYTTIPKSITKEKNKVSLFFLSRITPKKNLLGAIDILNSMKKRGINFDIIGPISNQKYWYICKKKIVKLNKTTSVNYLGSFPPNKIPSIINKKHFLFLPTYNENFGHVIAESLSLGCPVIISDNTPWSDVAKYKCGWVKSVYDTQGFKEIINKCITMSQDEYDNMSIAAKEYINKKYNIDSVIQENLELFLN